MTHAHHPLLIVDDDAANRDMLARRLVRLGYEVVAVDSGRAALDHLAVHPVGLMLLDVQMPDLTGLEVLEIVRRTRSSSELPILMVTAKDQSDDIVTALTLGANDYVSKPVDFPVAVARIRTHLSRKGADDRLRESEERYALAAAGANDGLWDWKIAAGSMHFTDRWKAIIGYEDREISTQPDEWFGRVHPDDLPRVRRELDAHLTGTCSHFESEHRVRHKSGAFRWVLTRGMVVREAGGVATRMAGSLADITQGKVMDALTGLPNRTLLDDRLERALQHNLVHPDAQFAVLFIDLDGFKLVNDSLGHLAGDEMLQAVARRLEGALRVTDWVARPVLDPPGVPGSTDHTLARLGGDEFVILLHDVPGVVEAARVADRIQEALAKPFQVVGREVFTTASIGIAISTSGYGRPADVLRDADIAMYRAKALGKGRCEVFDIVMREQLQERLSLDTAVRLGLEHGEFLPYYQPIVDLQTGRLTGFEALLRWRRPGHGIIAPGEFVPLIEENGLVVPIGRRFLEDVCQQLRRWHDTYSHADQLSVNINFASRQLLDAGMVDHLLRVLREWHLEPRHVVVEITESSAIGNFAMAANVLSRLRRAGIRVMLDDFGTGYSSLSHLHELPLNGIKLDRSFVNNDQLHPGIVRAVVALADQLDLTVTAEGIETVAQQDRLRALGCDFGQGFLFGRPLEADAAGRIVANALDWLPRRRHLGAVS